MLPGLQLPGPGQLYLITDQLASPASFLIHRALHSQLNSGSPCLLVSFKDEFDHWKAIAAKAVSQLQIHHPLELNMDSSCLNWTPT